MRGPARAFDLLGPCHYLLVMSCGGPGLANVLALRIALALWACLVTQNACEIDTLTGFRCPEQGCGAEPVDAMRPERQPDAGDRFAQAQQDTAGDSAPSQSSGGEAPRPPSDARGDASQLPPDAGGDAPQPRPDAGDEALQAAPDTGPVKPGGDLCVPNPSFEGASFPFAVPEWTTCLGSPDAGPGFSTFPPSDGEHYLALVASVQPTSTETVSTALCEPLTPGRAVQFTIDLTLSSAFGPVLAAPSHLEVWGGGHACSQDELLWASPILSTVDAWDSWCVTLVPSAAHEYLVLAAVMEDGALVNHYLLLDHIDGDATCE